MLPQILLIQALLQLSGCQWLESSEEDFADKVYVQQITNPVSHAEGPLWVEEDQALYYVDIAGHGVHRYDPITRLHTFLTLNDTVGTIIPIKDRSHQFIIGYGKKISVLSWDGISEEYSLHHKYEVDQDKLGNRFNDGKADIKGRLWIGTMGQEKPIGNVKLNQASLFKTNKKCALERKVLSPVSISNGLTWNLDNTVMYYIDSPTRKIDAFDFSACNGKLTNRRTFFDFEKYNITGVPDGMTNDADGNLWIAVWGGGRVIQVSGKTGKLLRSVWLPAEKVTSVVWGGHDYSMLFVTTMRLGLTKKQIEEQPAAGAVFKVVGLPAHGMPLHSAAPCYLALPDIP